MTNRYIYCSHWDFFKRDGRFNSSQIKLECSNIYKTRMHNTASVQLVTVVGYCLVLSSVLLHSRFCSQPPKVLAELRGGLSLAWLLWAGYALAVYGL